jgi:ABC-2 type transport system permease protein
LPRPSGRGLKIENRKLFGRDARHRVSTEQSGKYLNHFSFMNFFDRFFLAMFLSAAPVLQKMNINMNHLKAILVAKLTMDNRRPAAFQQMRASKEKKELNQATLKTMFVSLIMGLFFLMSFAIGNDITTKLTLFFSMFIFMLAATLITDFTSVLIDTRDNLIILPKPVNDATFVTARLIHIAIHINKLLLPMALPALIALIVIEGPATILPFILMILFATLLSIFLVNAVYILILKITKPSNFQSVISYFQIVFAIVIYGGYQLMPRMMSKMGIDTMKVSELHNIQYYPPYWFADTCNSLFTFTFELQNMYNLILAIGIPLISIFVVVKYFAPAFTRNLSMITGSTEEIKIKVISKKESVTYRQSWIEKLAKMMTSGSSEYTGFLFTWKMMGRSRDFKMKVYPGFGYLIVIIAMIMFQNNSASLADFSEMNEKAKSMFILFLYFGSFVVLSAIGQLPYSDKFKAAWIFAITPIGAPGKLLSGALKSVIICFYIPIVLLFSLFGIVIIGPSILPNLVLGCFNVLAVTSLIAYLTLRKLPFSVSSQDASKNKTTARNFLTMLIPMIIGGIHWLLFDFTWAVVILAVLAVIATWMIIDSIRNLNWAKIENFDVNR